MENVIFICRKCNKKYIAPPSPVAKYKCPTCGSILEQFQQPSPQPTSQPESLIGKKLGGCQILERLGGGAMGEVYKAKHIGLNKLVALKVISTAGRNMLLAERLILEARAAAKLDHPNIVQVYNVGIENNRCFIVMQLLTGIPLSQLLDKYGVLPLDKVTKITKNVSAGLSAAHKHGVIHRDLKPENIIVTDDWSAKIMDFGLALDVEDTASEKGSVIAGSPHYMSPEQWLGRKATPRSDLYSLGIVLYRITTGKFPFDAELTSEIMEQHLNILPPSPSELNPDVPETVSSVIKKLIAKAPPKRYQSADELVKDIERLERGIEPLAMQDFASVVSCSFCETMNPVNAKKCKTCGESLTKKTGEELTFAIRKDEFECPKCGNAIRFFSRACGGCGSAICKKCGKRPAVEKDTCLHCHDTDIVKG